MPAKSIAFDANTATLQSVTRWIQTGLDSYIRDGVGRWAFRPLECDIGKRDDLAEDLRAIYDSLTADAQARWRLAIRDLLATQGPDMSKREATQTLIDFAILVRAHEVLEVLPKLVANGHGEVMLDQIVRAATALASQTEASRDCLERIRTSPRFSADYAGLVLVALCHADPDNWLTHVENLSTPMQILASRLEDGSDALRFYAATTLEAISLNRVTSATAERLFDCTDFQWLSNEWFKGDQSLLRYEPETDSSGRLFLRANEAVSVPIDDGFIPQNLDDAAMAVDHENASAIAWAKAPRSRFWTAVCRDGRLAELTLKSYNECIEAQRSFLQIYQEAKPESQPVLPSWLTSDQHQAEAKSAMPDLAGILARYSEEPSVQIIPYNPASPLWSWSAGNGYTGRVLYFKEFNEKPQPGHRLAAIRNRHAFSAAVSAIGLAGNKVPSQ